MAVAQKFRSAFNGFNREDVVAYIEYLNAKHTGALNQLKSENQTLSEELAVLRSAHDPEADAELARLEEENQALTAQIEELKAQLAGAQQTSAQELEAYRRAEQAERSARERARQIYAQATGALADATTQVDEAADHFKLLSQRISNQMSDLESTVERSKSALLAASATMYTICPEESETP